MFRLTRTPADLYHTPGNCEVGTVRVGWYVAADLLCPVFVAFAITSCVGCARFDLRRNIPWQEAAGKPVQSVVVFWTDALIERRSGPPYRGFGGRVYFYPADMSRPVKVRGTLVIYAFDDNLPPPENLKPVRKFVFTNEQLEKVYAESKLGPSYNILIPWDEYSPTSQRISLIARFIPEEGPSVVSEQARVFLPGLESGLLSDKSATSGSTAVASASEVPQARSGATPVAAHGERGSALPAVFAGENTTPFQQTQTAAKTAASEASSDARSVPQRRMQTLTLNISSRGAGPVTSLNRGSENQARPEPAAAEHSVGSAEQTTAEGGTSGTQAHGDAAVSTQMGGRQTNPRPWTPPGSPLEYTPAQLPPSAGQLIDRMNLRPPTRSEPYPRQAPEAEGVPTPADR